MREQNGRVRNAVACGAELDISVRVEEDDGCTEDEYTALSAWMTRIRPGIEYSVRHPAELLSGSFEMIKLSSTA